MLNRSKKINLYIFALLITAYLATNDHIKLHTEILLSIRTANIGNENIKKIIERNNFIAHAGGGIDNKKYTNSKEAVLNSISRNYKLIELDLLITQDGEVVAAHDWKSFKKKSGINDSTKSPLNLEDFSKAKIYSKYEPLDIRKINKIFEANKEIYLITDKIRDFNKLAKLINYKDRVIVEVFNIKDYNKAINFGFTNIALNIRRLDNSTLKWLKINKIPAVTFGYYDNEKISLNDINKFCSNGISLMIYSDDDSKLSKIHEQTNCNNIAIYVDFLDIESWNYKK
jgi:glycerophosphoryl diester phosphodiesterase